MLDLLIVLVIVLFNGFFAMSEMAVLTSRKSRLRQMAVLNTLQTAGKTLVVDDKANSNLRLSIRNVEDKQFLSPEGVNVYDLLRHEHVVLSKDAVKAIEARCSEGAEA